MPIYHFQVHDDVSGASRDETGTDLPSREAAEREALRFAGMTIADSAMADRCPTEWHLDVTDHLGTVVFSLNVAARPAPAALVPLGLFASANHRLSVAAQ